jgi:hypothetical protein
MYGARWLSGSRTLAMAARTVISCLANDLLILGMGVSGASSARTGKGTIKSVHKAKTKMGTSHLCTEVPAEMSLMGQRWRSGFGTLVFSMYAYSISTIGCDCFSVPAGPQEKT